MIPVSPCPCASFELFVNTIVLARTWNTFTRLRPKAMTTSEKLCCMHCTQGYTCAALGSGTLHLPRYNKHSLSDRNVERAPISTS